MQRGQPSSPPTSPPPAAPPQPPELPAAPPRSPPAPPSSALAAPGTLPARPRDRYMASLAVPSGDELARIAEVQARRESEQKRRSRALQRERRPPPAAEAEAEAPPGGGEEGPPRPWATGHRLSRRHDGSARARAAVAIQRTYRGYRTRREMKGLGIDPSTRWVQALREAQFREMTRPRPSHAVPEHPDGGPGPGRTGAARQNWKRAIMIARRAGGDADDDDDDDAPSSSPEPSNDEPTTPEQREAERLRRALAKEERRKQAKVMGLQYFLEMVDLKHRYGSDLRVYQGQWKSADTRENFFYWLDHGEGRGLDMAACPRERLDRERVRYLSREERMHYLVTVDGQGRLCWAKNGARVDTTERYKDSVRGIVPADDPTPAFSAPDAPETEPGAARGAEHADGPGGAEGPRKVRHLSASAVVDQLLRRSVRKNTWIFVADTSFRLYVGIKDSGAFQHSSFLQGSHISAAGLVTVRRGRLTSLSPLSGHYKPPASNFRAFVRSLRAAGVDMRHVSVSKFYAVLAGLELYARARRGGEAVARRVARRRDEVVRPGEVRRRDEAGEDKSRSAATERQVLRERGAREWARAGRRLVPKLRPSPRVLPARKEDEDGEENARGAGGGGEHEH